MISQNNQFLREIGRLATCLFLCHWLVYLLTATGIILYIHSVCIYPAIERWHYIVTSSLIGWAHTHNDPCSNNTVCSHITLEATITGSMTIAISFEPSTADISYHVLEYFGSSNLDIFVYEVDTWNANYAAATYDKTAWKIGVKHTVCYIKDKSWTKKKY